MIHRLSAIFTAVDDESISFLGDALLPGDLRGGQLHLPQQLQVFRLQVIQAGNMPAGNNQYMDWGFGVDISEGQQVLVAVHFSAWYLTRGDIAE